MRALVCQCGHEEQYHYRTETTKWAKYRCHGVTRGKGHLSELCDCRAFVAPLVKRPLVVVLSTIAMAVLGPLIVALLAVRLLEWLCHLVTVPILRVLRPVGLTWVFAIRGGVPRRKVLR